MHQYVQENSHELAPAQVAAGQNGNGQKQIEIIDLEDKEARCTTLQDFPKGLAGAVGGLVDNIPIICGGVDSDHDDSLDCYSLRGDKFAKTGQLST